MVRATVIIFFFFSLGWVTGSFDGCITCCSTHVPFGRPIKRAVDFTHVRAHARARAWKHVKNSQFFQTHCPLIPWFANAADSRKNTSLLVFLSVLCELRNGYSLSFLHFSYVSAFFKKNIHYLSPSTWWPPATRGAVPTRRSHRRTERCQGMREQIRLRKHEVEPARLGELISSRAKEREEKRRQKEVEWLVQGHRANQW